MYLGTGNKSLSSHDLEQDLVVAEPRKSAAVLNNSVAIGARLKVHCDQYTRLLQKKAFTWKYIEHGLDEMDFTETESMMNDTLSEWGWTPPDGHAGYYDHFGEGEDEEEEEEY